MSSDSTFFFAWNTSWFSVHRMEKEKVIINGRPVYIIGTKRLFKNSLLESLSRTGPVLTLFTYIPIIVFFVFAGIHQTSLGILSNILLYLTGVLAWTLNEYLMHRFIFHMEKGLGGKIAYYLHGIHHEYPKDKSRLFMPPIPGIIIISIFFCFFYLFLHEFTYLFMAGWLTGYLIYVFMHYCFHAMSPPKKFKKLWIYHANHHFRHHDKGFGVSTRLWDRIFKTLPDK